MNLCLRHILALAATVICGHSSPSLAQTLEPRSELESARANLQSAANEYADAISAISRAEVAQMRLEKLVEVEYQARQDLVELRQYAGEMTLHFNALRNDVLAELEQDPAYSERRDAEKDAEAAFRAAKATPDSSLKQEISLAHALMSVRKELTRFESAALAMDPAIEDARQEMFRAHELANRLEARYRKQAASDERLSQSRDEVAHARERSEVARSALASALAQNAAAERRDAIRSASRRADMPPIQREDP